MPELPEAPLNSEPQTQQLISSFITKDHCFNRNHCLLPSIEDEQHRIRIDGMVKQKAELSMSDLRTRFQQHSVTCVLQCAGNRRHTMRTHIKEVQGLDWFDGAAMNCKWSGPMLKDVLESCGIDLNSTQQEAAHVAFASYVEPCQEDTWYGASIPLSRALDPDADVILALGMNDQPLTREHGYPVRVVCPGIAGARNVKWLDQISVQMEQSKNHYMLYDYKVLPEAAVDSESAKQFWHSTPPVQDMPVNSIIAEPGPGESIVRSGDGKIAVRGYALPGGRDGPVAKVEVSSDLGASWTAAELTQDDAGSKWAWTLWSAHVSCEPGENKTIYSRATDTGGNQQPEKSQWNLRGVCWNGYGVVSDLTIE